MGRQSHDRDNSRTVVRLFTGLANDEEEEWLSKMDADGWRLASRARSIMSQVHNLSMDKGSLQR